VFRALQPCRPAWLNRGEAVSSATQPPHPFCRYDLELALLEGRSSVEEASSRLGTGQMKELPGPPPRAADNARVASKNVQVGGEGLFWLNFSLPMLWDNLILQPSWPRRLERGDERPIERCVPRR